MEPDVQMPSMSATPGPASRIAFLAASSASDSIVRPGKYRANGVVPTPAIATWSVTDNDASYRNGAARAILDTCPGRSVNRAVRG
jgi:hypothetical protein